MKEKDCINRQAVLDTLDKIDKALDTDRTIENYKELLTECYKALPSVTPEPPEDDDRKCMRCKHCIKREGPGWANPYGCDAWTCEFEKKEEDEEWEN